MLRLFVPGRVCLFGEHSDWAGSLRAVDPTIAAGACIIAGTDQGITADVGAAPVFEMTSRLPGGEQRGPFRVPMEDAALRAEAASGGFFRYAAGVAAETNARHRVGGLRVDVTDVDLPAARGLSSSAAICVLTARAFNRIYDLGLDVDAEMDLAYRGELAAGSQCGRMDQACAFGRRLLLLRFDGDDRSVEALQPRRELHLLIVDLMHEKDTRRILADLHAHLTSADSPHRHRLRDALGPANQELVTRACAALEQGDARAVGALMGEAQARFDEAVAPACRAELTAPRLHALLRLAAVREATWGGKGIGSQGDGAAQLVCRGPEHRDELAKELRSTGRFECWPLAVGPQPAPA